MTLLDRVENMRKKLQESPNFYFEPGFVVMGEKEYEEYVKVVFDMSWGDIRGKPPESKYNKLWDMEVVRINVPTFLEVVPSRTYAYHYYLIDNQSALEQLASNYTKAKTEPNEGVDS